MVKIIAVESFKGGTGKSTIAANLAVTIAQLGRRVGVIDMDLEGPGLHVIFGVSDSEVKATINDVLQHKAEVGQATVDLSAKARVHGGRLIFCPAGHKLQEIMAILDAGFNLSTFKTVLEQLSRDYQLDYLIIDSHPGVEKDTLLSMALCDYLILISRVDQQDLFGSGVLTEVAGQLHKPVVLILNMVPSSVNQKETQKIANRLAELFHLNVLTALPFNSDVLENLSRAVFVLEYPQDPLTHRFTELAATLLDALEGKSDYFSRSRAQPQTLS